jgi:hypothetical protein
MGRFDQKYTDAQREAILRATCDDGMSVRAAVMAAKAGGLYGLDPFDFNERTAADYAAKERERRRGQAFEAKQAGPPDQQLDAFAGMNIRAIEAQAAMIRRKRKWDAEDAELMRKLGQIAREMRGLLRGVPLASSGTRNRQNADKATPPTTTPDTSPLTRELLGRMGHGQGEAQQTNGHTEPGEGGHDVPAHAPEAGGAG